jgi:putative flippase GtrA
VPPRLHSTLRQLLKTVVASQAAFWLDFGILALLTEAAGLHYLASAAVAFLAGTTVSYVLSIVWVFDTRRVASKAAEYALFVLVGAVGLALNEVLLWVFTEPLGLHYLVSKVVAATLIFGWNFGARKLLLFR